MDQVKLTVECFGRDSLNLESTRDEMFKFYKSKLDQYRQALVEWLENDMPGYKPVYHGFLAGSLLNKKGYLPIKMGPFLLECHNLDKQNPNENMLDFFAKKYLGILPEWNKNDRLIRDNSWTRDTNKYMIKLRASKNLEYYDDNLVRNFVTIYESTGKIAVDILFQALGFISHIRCGYPSPMTFELLDYMGNNFYRKINDFVYPYLTDSAEYNIYDYIYALSNRVVLVGIPVDYSMADSISYCPLDFFTHDLTHNQIMYEHILSNIDDYKNIYNEIMEEADPDRRDLKAFSVWYLIHEIGKVTTDIDEILESPNVIIDLLRDMIPKSYKKYVEEDAIYIILNLMINLIMELPTVVRIVSK